MGGAALANPVAAAATRRVDGGALSSACISESDSMIDLMQAVTESLCCSAHRASFQ